MAACVPGIALLSLPVTHPLDNFRHGGPLFGATPAMSSERIGLVERAYELANSGDVVYVYRIERQLIAEGYARVAVTFGDSPELRIALRDCIKTRGKNKSVARKVGGKP